MSYNKRLFRKRNTHFSNMNTRSKGYNFVEANVRKPDQPRTFRVRLPEHCYDHIPQRLTEALQGWDACYGDMVVNEAEYGYRSAGIYMHDGHKVIELSTDITPYGTIPPCFEVGRPHPIYKTPIPFWYWRCHTHDDFANEDKDARIDNHCEVYWNAYRFRAELLQNVTTGQSTWCRAYDTLVTINFLDLDDFTTSIQEDQADSYNIQEDQTYNKNEITLEFVGGFERGKAARPSH